MRPLSTHCLSPHPHPHSPSPNALLGLGGIWTLWGAHLHLKRNRIHTGRQSSDFECGGGWLCRWVGGNPHWAPMGRMGVPSFPLGAKGFTDGPGFLWEGAFSPLGSNWGSWVFHFPHWARRGLMGVPSPPLGPQGNHRGARVLMGGTFFLIGPQGVSFEQK